MGRRLFVILSVLLLSTASHAQGRKYSYKKKFGTQKNAAYFTWGYNRSAYTLSDINFYGPDYSFIVKDAKAHDRPARKINEYFDPRKFTTPQFNVRFGWYYKFRWDISIGYDHMKYVMDDYQSLLINGVIEDEFNPLYGTYTDEDGPRLIKRSELHYENTNGLNYVSLALNNTAPIYKTKNLKFAVLRRMGGGFGPVITQTDFTWDGVNHESRFKVAGFGISANAGLRFDFFNRFFFQSNWTAGWINLPKNNTIQSQQHFAKHNFFFAEWDLSMGLLFYFRIVNGCDTCPDWH